MKFNYIYKCRLCDSTFVAGPLREKRDDAYQLIVDATVALQQGQSLAALHLLHHCKVTNGWGIGELQGVAEVAE